MNEPDGLPRLLECISRQRFRSFKLFVCVNQPDNWWDDPQKMDVCMHNAEAIRLLNAWDKFPVEVIDRSSAGLGWTGKRHGVGFARKVVMDAIAGVANPGDIIVSIDADTTFSDNYLESVAGAFSRNGDAVAMAIPYFHRQPNDPAAYRAILRYEIYMRHYFLNLLRIGSPYSFTALGSAMAFTVKAYKSLGGITPKLSGEDFYFLQKLRKFGRILLWNDECVYPEARFSDRVFFGTGPAMIKGAGGDWSSYPIYALNGFNEIMETTLLFPVMFIETMETRVTRFMANIFSETDPWKPLRENSVDVDHFIRACHEKLDGLRVLQYLKSEQEKQTLSDEERFIEWITRYYGKDAVRNLKLINQDLSFINSSTEDLEKIRSFLFEKEMEERFNSELV